MRRPFWAGHLGSWRITVAPVLVAPRGLLRKRADVSHLTGVDMDDWFSALSKGSALPPERAQELHADVPRHRPRPQAVLRR
jgi:hypothetical protein